MPNPTPTDPWTTSLRRALLANAVFSTLCAVTFLAVSGPLAELVGAIADQGRIPPQLVDHEAADPLSLLGGEQHHGAEQGRENAAAVDVPDQQGRSLGVDRDP